MDRNSIIGLLIIGSLIIGYSIYTQPSETELAALKHKRDSVMAVQEAQRIMDEQMRKAAIAAAPADTVATVSDSARAVEAEQQLGIFSAAASGKEQLFKLENDLIKVTLSSLGGRVKAVELKKYKTHDGKPVILMNDDSSMFNLSFPAQNRTINSSELYFTSSGVKSGGSVKSISLRLNAGDKKYVEFLYSIADGNYLLNYKVNMVGLDEVVSPNASYLAFDWREQVKPQELSMENERAATTVYYYYPEEKDVDYISYTSDERTSLKTKVKWISFKQQFFTSVLIADHALESPIVESKTDQNSTKAVKLLTASFSLPYDHKPEESFGMRFYFGPTHYQTLKKIEGLQLEKQIHLGWGIFGWVNRFGVIPIFNFLDSFNINYGIIILILTIIIRIVLLPLTFTSYKSQAKMKVLQPEVKEINEKYPDDAMKKQQEMMKLYKQAGVNPMGGCIPGLLQMPILIAMFSFFPTSIELRQQSFLWANDLSTYDSILDFGFKIPFYGDHVSLFTILMTISTLLFTKINMQMTSAANPQMKWIMYLMPVMFLGIFNNYSAGLSYYYFLSNLFGLGQQYGFKFFIDEDAIHRKIQENKKKPVKKSGFQTRLEEMAKQRGYPAKR